MFIFALYALGAIWYYRTRMSVITMLILIEIFCLTLVQSILEIRHMGFRETRLEWLLIRIIELIFRLFSIILMLIYIFYLRKDYQGENFQWK